MLRDVSERGDAGSGLNRLFGAKKGAAKKAEATKAPVIPPIPAALTKPPTPPSQPAETPVMEDGDSPPLHHEEPPVRNKKPLPRRLPTSIAKCCRNWAASRWASRISRATSSPETPQRNRQTNRRRQNPPAICWQHRAGRRTTPRAKGTRDLLTEAETAPAPQARMRAPEKKTGGDADFASFQPPPKEEDDDAERRSGDDRRDEDRPGADRRGCRRQLVFPSVAQHQ